jgi:hypothetical protein
MDLRFTWRPDAIQDIVDRIDGPPAPEVIPDGVSG